MLVDTGRLDEAVAACGAAIETFPDEAAVHLRLGLILRQRGQLIEATQAFDAAARLNPDATECLIQLADTLRWLGRLEEAAAKYHAVLALAPDHIWAHVGLGYAARARGQGQEALRYFRFAAGARPADSLLALELAEVALQMGEAGEAAALFARLREERPGDARVHVGLGHVAKGQGRAEDAVAHYQAAAATRSDDAGLQLEIAELLQGLGRQDDAAAAFAEAMRLAPDTVRAHVSLGHIARSRGNRAEALRHFEAAAALQPDEPERQMNLADELREAGRVEEAEARYREALNLAPKNGWAFFGLGKCARARGRRGEAVAYFNVCAQLQPDNFWPLLELAQEQQETGDRDGGRQTLESLLARFPGNSQALLSLGNLERNAGRLERALAVFTQGHGRHPDEAIFLIRMAEVCRALNDEEAFLAHINAALVLEPHNGTAIQALAAFYLVKARPEEALGLFTAALAAQPEDVVLATAYADTLAQAGFADECLAVLEELREHGADSPSLAGRSISQLRLSGRIRQAVACARAAVESWPHDFELRNALFHAGLFWLDEDALVACLGQMKPATVHETSVLHRNEGRLAELHFHLAEAVRHYEESARLNVTDASLQNDLARLKMMQMDLAGARAHLTRSRDLDAPNLRTSGKSLNISQTMFGQILDDLALAECSLPVAQLVALPLAERLPALAAAVQAEPGNTAAAMQVLLALREEGVCAWQNDGALAGVPAQIIQFWDSAEVPGDVAAIMHSWQEQNPDYAVKLFDDGAARAYLQARFAPPVLQAFLRAREPAQKSDIFRLAVLGLEGGVYADADDRCVGPLAPLLGAQDQLVVYQEEFGTAGNNFLAVGPGHPMILNALDQAVMAINRSDSEIVWLSTGPGLMTRVFAQAYFTPGALPGRTRLLDRRGLGRVVAMHCMASYKRGARHWLNANFPRGLTRRARTAPLPSGS